MFGLSFFEVVIIGVVALVAVGPKRLPGMLRDMGGSIRKLRKMTTDVRAQTGIDDILRTEGLHGGLNELRSLMRGGQAPAQAAYRPPEDPLGHVELDVQREYPPEGADAKGAIPDELVEETPMDERPIGAEERRSFMSDEDEEKRGGNDPEKHQMTIWEHLEELRSRIVKMMLAFLLGAIVSWIYRKELFGIMTVPFVEAWKAARPDAPIITFPAPASLFIAYVRISAISGIVMALPIMLWQVWAFVSPGLYSREKRLAVPFVVSSCALFAAGGYFAWKVAFKLAFQFFLSMSGQVGQIEVKPSVMVSEYLDFVTNMLLAFGLMAELPVLVFFLSVAGLVNHRHLIKFFRYFIVIAFVVAAVITPPDPLSQLLLAVPLVLLYVVSILVAYVFSRRRDEAVATDDDEDKKPPRSKAAE